MSSVKFRLLLILSLSLILTAVNAQTFPGINIEIEQDSINELESHPYTNEDVHGNFVVDGMRTENVELHYRGAYNLWSLIRKGSLRNWKVKFEKTEMYENRREWNFNYEKYIRQNLSYQLFKEAGVPCVSAENVVLSVNGARQGIYLKYEDPDNKTWLADEFGEDEEIRDYIRLFLFPGVLHCYGGPGPSEVNLIKILRKWVEEGIAPERVILSKSTDEEVIMTRPVFPYPIKAIYNGEGNPNIESSFNKSTPMQK